MKEFNEALTENWRKCGLMKESDEELKEICKSAPQVPHFYRPLCDCTTCVRTTEELRTWFNSVRTNEMLNQLRETTLNSRLIR